jgi:hypothetical protein
MNRIVMPTPFDETPTSAKTRVPAPVLVKTRKTRLIDAEPLTLAPACAFCTEPGAGTPYEGKLYHMACKLTQKRLDRV